MSADCRVKITPTYFTGSERWVDVDGFRSAAILTGRLEVGAVAVGGRPAAAFVIGTLRNTSPPKTIPTPVLKSTTAKLNNDGLIILDSTNEGFNGLIWRTDPSCWRFPRTIRSSLSAGVLPATHRRECSRWCRVCPCPGARERWTGHERWRIDLRRGQGPTLNPEAAGRERPESRRPHPVVEQQQKDRRLAVPIV